MKNGISYVVVSAENQIGFRDLFSRTIVHLRYHRVAVLDNVVFSW